jgi:rsbT antagonist protein RsbS
VGRVSMLRFGDILLVPVPAELHDAAARDLQDSVLTRLETEGAHGLVIDVSAASVVDSFMARLLGDTAKGARLMGVDTVLVGMQPAVVITLLQLGVVFHDVRTALNIEAGIALLQRDRRGSDVDGWLASAELGPEAGG